MKRIRLSVLGVLPVLVLLASGCSDSGHMLTGTSGSPPGTSVVKLVSPDIKIDGQSVNGATIPPGSGPSSLFTVSLANPQDQSSVARVQMDYTQHSPMGMMGETMTVDCYDDGTHGDMVPGDGTYSYMDVDGHVGPQYNDCVAGQYVYMFHGTDTMGQHTNAVECSVTVE
jgi:hypothetical protein